MFEQEILLGDTERSIVLQTRLGNPIKNAVAPEPGETQRRRYGALRKKHGANWNNRKPACGGYNCYGMVFAARRTAVYEDDQVERMLLDDGYRVVADEREVEPGDLVAYRDAERGTLRHIALLLRRESISLGVGGGGGALYALSKWNDTYGEDVHHIRHHVWSDDDVKLEFWTDRPVA